MPFLFFRSTFVFSFCGMKKSFLIHASDFHDLVPSASRTATLARGSILTTVIIPDADMRLDTWTHLDIRTTRTPVHTEAPENTKKTVGERDRERPRHTPLEVVVGLPNRPESLKTRGFVKFADAGFVSVIVNEVVVVGISLRFVFCVRLCLVSILNNTKCDPLFPQASARQSIRHNTINASSRRCLIPFCSIRLCLFVR